MKLFSKQIGANGLLEVDLTLKGLEIDLTDSEALSDQELHEVVKPDAIIDKVVSLFKAPAWLVSVAAFVKAELATLEAKP